MIRTNAYQASPSPIHTRVEILFWSLFSRRKGPRQLLNLVELPLIVGRRVPGTINSGAPNIGDNMSGDHSIWSPPCTLSIVSIVIMCIEDGLPGPLISICWAHIT